MKQIFRLTVAAFLFFLSSYASAQPEIHNHMSNILSQRNKIRKELDTILKSKPDNPFNGIILIKEKDSIVYSLSQGYADLASKRSLDINDQFVIGSISKQMTAVLVLRELEQKHLQLNDAIGKYLPQLKQSWKDSVTIYHLLTHTHGIARVDAPLIRKPGVKMDYEYGNNVGYQLLSEIVAKTSGRSFAELVMQLFTACGMKNSFHPTIKKYKNLAKAYTQDETGKFVFESSSFAPSPAAGALVSTAGDLMKWNECLHGGKLLQPETYKLMTTIQPNVIRQHPIFGATEYGLGTTIDTKENVVRLGQTGFTPGYASMDYYFPETKTSVVVFDNVIYSSSITKNFYHHVRILEMLHEKLKPENFIAEKNVLKQNSDSLPYRLLYPAKQALTKKYPLLIYLHGTGNRGTDNEQPLQKVVTYFFDSATGNKFPCFVLIPQCPQNEVWVSFPNFPKNLSATSEPTSAAKLVLALIHHLVETKDIDTNRVYLTGYSMGGEGTFDFLNREPDLFAAAIPLASVADTSKANVIKHVPIWAFHGSDDKVNEVKYIRMEIEVIRKHGGNSKYSEIKGVGHDVRNDAYNNKELWQWVFEQHK